MDRYENIDEYVMSLDNVKLVLGNGFDLTCNLKSKYNDYFEKNVKKIVKNKEEMYILVKKCEAYLMDRSIVPYFNNPFILNKPNNVWELYFLLISIKNSVNYDNLNWCDVEKTMKDSFVDELDFKETSFWDLVYDNLCYKNNVIDGDIEIICAAYIKLIINESDPKPEKDYFYNKILMYHLIDFEMDFGSYIDRESKKPRYIENTENLICKLVNVEKGKLTSIDSFNYTIIDKYSNIFINVNGDTTTPIFGIDSLGINLDVYKFNFTKAKRRFDLQTSTNYIPKNVNFENIVIFGHSLSENDYGYYFNLFDEIKLLDGSAKGVIVLEYIMYGDNKITDIRSERENDLIKLIFAYQKEKGITNYNLFEKLTYNHRILLREIKGFVPKSLI